MRLLVKMPNGSLQLLLRIQRALTVKFRVSSGLAATNPIRSDHEFGSQDLAASGSLQASSQHLKAPWTFREASSHRCRFIRITRSDRKTRGPGSWSAGAPCASRPGLRGLGPGSVREKRPGAWGLCGRGSGGGDGSASSS